MISVEEARQRVFSLLSTMPVEAVPLAQAAGRVLAEPVSAERDQPPFPASAMDGYALRNVEVHEGATFTVIGTAAAGHAFEGSIGEGQAVRIFTGAPVPPGADRVVIQEDTQRAGDTITLSGDIDPQHYVRPAGNDFPKGFSLLAPRVLSASDLALIASMNRPVVMVHRRPVVAIIATGDELVMPGEVPRDDQIIASNAFGLKALAEAQGAETRLLPIAKDTHASLRMALELAEGADMIVTIGGASVGDHDLVGEVAQDMGLERSFYKIAMRPGKPLMAGRMGDAVMLGLPGNPVSSMVCAHLFMLPALDAMQGLPAAAPRRHTARLATPLGPNGQREHYMRAQVKGGEITAFDRQDSALLSILSDANALLIRPVGDGSRETGETVEYLRIAPER
ncbi:MAG: molybdopterin molybdotransferase MoeA [Paracoccaceae bacterium]|nr:molybdopterin molybdotransferase MoeA [Paracoccaceae bacterium]